MKKIMIAILVFLTTVCYAKTNLSATFPGNQRAVTPTLGLGGADVVFDNGFVCVSQHNATVKLVKIDPAQLTVGVVFTQIQVPDLSANTGIIRNLNNRNCVVIPATKIDAPNFANVVTQAHPNVVANKTDKFYSGVVGVKIRSHTQSTILGLNYIKMTHKVVCDARGLVTVIASYG